MCYSLGMTQGQRVRHQFGYGKSFNGQIETFGTLIRPGKSWAAGEVRLDSGEIVAVHMGDLTEVN